ncbi:endonuclease [Vibrio variabilis]|uniref:Endonuclease n=1 Tax=Vibrio variabilis TaxID=990271 RepID=A0ABR4Y7C8_9VIBR|nr:endonuclease/exonuclease/phosphatase family protein [Vibrio variabilis]KHA59384.1 endonuclease [Vibrio variabilis]
MIWIGVFAPSLVWVALTFYEVTWWAENVVTFPSLFFITYLFVACVLLFCQRWVWSLISCSFAAVFWLLSPVSVQKVSHECANAITVAQYNLLYDNENLNEVLSYLHNHAFDLVVLQEVSPPVGEKIQLLDDIYPYMYGGQEGVGYPSGQMILSQTELSGLSVYWTSDRQAIIQGIWRPNKQQAFQLMTAHPPSPRSLELWQRRNALMGEVGSLLSNHTNDEVLIVGDFNLSAISLRFARLFPSFQTAPVASWPNRVKQWYVPASFMIAIDHLWLKSTNEGRRICQRESKQSPSGSDHRLIVTEIGY